MRIDVLGVQFDAVTLDEAVQKSLSLLERPGVHHVVTPNPEIVWLCQKDKRVMKIVSEASLVLADGIGVVRAAKKLGRPLPERVTGVDWAQALIPELEKLGKRLFLFGGKPGVAERAAATLIRKHPKLIICGTQHGYVAADGETETVVSKIRAAKPDVVFICLGSPKQENWMFSYSGYLDGSVLLAGLGGSLDVWAGTVKRAPKTVRKLGLEWIYRIVKQPYRVTRIAFVVPRYIRAVNRQKRRERHG